MGSIIFSMSPSRSEYYVTRVFAFREDPPILYLTRPIHASARSRPVLCAVPTLFNSLGSFESLRDRRPRCRSEPFLRAVVDVLGYSMSYDCSSPAHPFSMLANSHTPFRYFFFCGLSLIEYVDKEFSGIQHISFVDRHVSLLMRYQALL